MTLRLDPYACWLGSSECENFRITSKVQTYLDLVQSDGIHSVKAAAMRELVLAPFESHHMSVAA